MSATATMPLGTSNLRGPSRQTRTNPTRTSKTVGSSLRQNSFMSNLPPATQGATEPHGMYPAIQHFADAITALPRDYRRHTSLLKEVDAKAWLPEENLQTLLTQCASNRNILPPSLHTQSANASTANLADDAPMPSAANSVVSAPHDGASQYSVLSTAPSVAQRRQLFQALRQNLMQIMVTMDEKNHVINNANDELSRHIRRLDNIWPHIADEISEEARMGSLKHWAYIETVPNKKNAPTTRREAAANLAMLHDSEIAQRSESRREAVAARSKKTLARIDAGFAEVNTNTKKVAATERRRAAEAEEITGLGITGAGKGRKPAKMGGLAMEKSLSAAVGGRAMSREPSQQENGKKRKAPAGTSTIARKRYVGSIANQAAAYASRFNANQDSPKLASSPLASNFGRDAYKNSPALGSARPVASRARQNSTQTNEHSRARPPSSASVRNGVSASTPDLKSVAAVTGKTASEVKNTMKETTNSRGDRLLEDDLTSGGNNNDAGIRGGLLLERTASRQGGTRDLDNSAQAVDSPRLDGAVMAGRGRASKVSTPTVGTFAEADSSTANENGNGKSRRAVRPRAKDHGLHDSLSPKGLPLKRSHKKGAGLLAQQQATQRMKQEVENTVLMEEGDEDGEEFAEDEEKYCYCDRVSYGEMIACDNPKCLREWFHLECIGLKNAPKSEKWFCDECKEKVVKKNGNGR